MSGLRKRKRKEKGRRSGERRSGQREGVGKGPNGTIAALAACQETTLIHRIHRVCCLTMNQMSEARAHRYCFCLL